MKIRKPAQVLLLTVISASMAVSIAGCHSNPSSVSSSSSASTSSAETSSVPAVSSVSSSSETGSQSTSSSSEPQKPTVTVSDDPTIAWGTENPDLTQFFTVTAGDATFKVTAEMITGTVNPMEEGIYPITFAATIQGEDLTAHCDVQVISKVEIGTPYTEDPGITNLTDDTSTTGASMNPTRLMSYFTVSVDDRKIAIQPDWISGETGQTPGAVYPITLTVPVNGRKYTKTIHVHYCDSNLYLFSAYSKKTLPFQVEKGTANATDFDFTSLFYLQRSDLSGINYLSLADADKTGTVSSGDTVLMTIDKSKVDFSVPGIYAVQGTVYAKTAQDSGSNLAAGTCTAYLEITPNVRITDSSVKSLYQVGDLDSTFDPRSLFRLTQSGKELAFTELTLVTDSGFDPAVGADYDIIVSYEEVKYTRTLHYLGSSFFGTYTLYPFQTASVAEITVAKDGTVAMNWQDSGKVPIETVGTLSFTGKGKVLIKTTNSYVDYSLSLCYQEGVFYQDPDSYLLNDWEASFEKYTKIYCNTSFYTVKGYFRDKAEASAGFGMDLLILTDKSTEKDVYFGFYFRYDTDGESYENYDLTAVYGPSLLQVSSFDLTLKTADIIINDVGEFQYALTVDSTTGSLTAIRHSAYTAANSGPGVTAVDPTGLSKQTLTGPDAETLVLTWSQSGNYNAYAAVLSTLKGTGDKAYLIENTDDEAVFEIVDGVKDSTGNYVYSFREVRVTKTALTFTYVTDSALGLSGQYLVSATRSRLLAFSGDYVFFSTNSSRFSGMLMKVTDNGDGTYQITNNDFQANTGFNYFQVQFADKGNTVSVLTAEAPGYIGDVYEIYGDVKGVYIKGSKTSIALNSTAPEVGTLFTVKHKDADGNVVTVPADEVTYSLSSIDTSVSGVTAIVASYEVNGVTYYGTAVITVSATPLAGKDIVGTYQGYWTAADSSMINSKISSLIIKEDGTYTMAIGFTNVTDYLLPTEEDNTYQFFLHGFSGTLWYEDGAVYAIVGKTVSRTALMIAVKTQTTDTLTHYFTSSNLLTGQSRQALFTVKKDSEGKETYYLLTSSYHGEATLEETASLGTDSQGYVITEYHFTASESQDILIRYGVLTVSATSHSYKAIASDGYRGTYNFGQGCSAVLDGFGTMTVSGLSDADLMLSYYQGFGSSLIAFNGDGSVVLHFTIEGALLTQTDDVKADAMEGKTYSARFIYYASKTYPLDCYELSAQITFDGHGYAHILSTYLNEYLAYEIEADGTIQLRSLALPASTTALTPSATNGNLISGSSFTIDSLLSMDSHTTLTSLPSSEN
jgi:hypothetical protein